MVTFLGLERFSPPLSYFLASVAPLSYRPLSNEKSVSKAGFTGWFICFPDGLSEGGRLWRSKSAKVTRHKYKFPNFLWLFISLS